MKRVLIPCAAALLLAACSAQPVRNPLAEWVPSPNFDARKPVAIVIHATEQHSAEESLRTLRTANRGGPVSAHYLIGDDGRLYQLVADGARAWHAGAGRWGALVDLNSTSIGIELDNARGEPYSEAQIATLLRLLEDLTRRFKIPAANVIAHADMAPTRKVDPGPLFPWRRLAEAGFGLWPEGELQDPPPGFDPWLAMALIGYPLDDRAAAVRAFQRHYRGHEPGDDHDARFSAEDLRILHALQRQRVPR